MNMGTISHGTLRPEDLLETFADTLAELSVTPQQIVAEARTIDPDSEAALWLIDQLTDALNEYAAPYFYFGAHHGDGSDFGFWLYEEAIDEFDGLKVSDTSEIPGDYTGEAMHINDHGNVTLYACQDGECSEVWAIV